MNVDLNSEVFSMFSNFMYKWHYTAHIILQCLFFLFSFMFLKFSLCASYLPTVSQPHTHPSSICISQASLLAGFPLNSASKRYWDEDRSHSFIFLVFSPACALSLLLVLFPDTVTSSLHPQLQPWPLFQSPSFGKTPSSFFLPNGRRMAPSWSF